MRTLTKSWRATLSGGVPAVIVVLALVPPGSAVGIGPGSLRGPVEAPAAGVPVQPPARICGNSAILDGPAEPPDGAVVVPAGDNSSFDPALETTYWFAPGTHTLGSGEFDQIIPADGDVFVGAPGAILDGGRVNRYAFTQHARNVTVEHLTIIRFGARLDNRDEGVVNHDSGHMWTIRYNTVRNNEGAGVFVGSGSRVRYNCLSHNGQYGFSAYEAGGDRNVVLDHNEIVGNNTDDWDRRIPGCGCVGGGKFWNVDGATVTNNWVHDNRGPGLWADTDDNDFVFEHNYLDRNDGEGIEYEISYNASIVNNTFIRNALVYGRDNPGFPTGAVYLSESGGDARVAARSSTLEVSGNTFVDNWSGVVLWENADRFCGSPANTSSGYCTLVNKKVVNLKTCVKGVIDDDPYYSDCRWKTEHVLVRDNRFAIEPSHIAGCTPQHSCGLQGLFSNYGTFPKWSPYQGPVIERAITFHQDNVWRHNAYVGPWRFMVHDQGRVVGHREWQAGPYRQDVGSTFDPPSR